MTASQSPHEVAQLITHQGFRRLFAELPERVRAAAPGDTALAAVLTDHFHALARALRRRQAVEDEQLWPVLLERAGGDRTLVLRAEEQHERIRQLLDRAALVGASFRADATSEHREAFAVTAAELGRALDEHLADERQLLPLVQRCVSATEWGELRSRASGQ